MMSVLFLGNFIDLIAISIDNKIIVNV